MLRRQKWNLPRKLQRQRSQEATNRFILTICTRFWEIRYFAHRNAYANGMSARVCMCVWVSVCAMALLYPKSSSFTEPNKQRPQRQLSPIHIRTNHKALTKSIGSWHSEIRPHKAEFADVCQSPFIVHHRQTCRARKIKTAPLQKHVQYTHLGDRWHTHIRTSANINTITCSISLDRVHSSTERAQRWNRLFAWLLFLNVCRVRGQHTTPTQNQTQRGAHSGFRSVNRIGPS